MLVVDNVVREERNQSSVAVPSLHPWLASTSQPPQHRLFDASPTGMASSRISAPIRGVTCQLGRLPIRRNATPARCSVCAPLSTSDGQSDFLQKLYTPLTRSISTSTSANASVSPITTSVDGFVPIKPFEERTVLATIHQFPSLEPLRFEQYPANHLYLPTRRDILHRAVIYEGDKTRRGTASTKTRYEVRGSARKIRPQKGSGRARLGDKKSPMLRGGGVAFGPKPRDFSTELQKKVYHLAWRTALSYRYRKGELIIVDNAMEIEAPSTRLLGDIFGYQDKLLGKGRSLLVTLEERPLLEQALMDMDRGKQAVTWEEVDVKNLLELSRIIIERDALHNILLTHQEDLTHKTPRPTSIIRSLPPNGLESTIGWQEFRTLALTPSNEKDAARPEAYDGAASSRYVYAESLPEGRQRTELTVAAHRLRVEAKELRFLQTTGLAFQEYTKRSNTPGISTVRPIFPRLKALDYQIRVKGDLAATAAETSHQKEQEVTIDILQLQVDKLEIQYEAALIGAQVYEHTAEAEHLSGKKEKAVKTLETASRYRDDVDRLDLQMVQAKLEVAKQKLLVAGLQGDVAGQRKAEVEVEKCTQAVHDKRAELRDAQRMEEFDEVTEETPDEIEAPRVEK